MCCTVYGGFPTRGMWWGVTGACTGAMTLVGETLSRRREMRAIAVAGRDVEAGVVGEENA